MEKETETVTVKSESISDDRRQSIIIRGLFDHWQLLFLLAGGIVACIKFYFTVTGLAEGQAKWQVQSEQRREKAHDDLEAIRIKQAQDERDIEWLKGRK